MIEPGGKDHGTQRIRITRAEKQLITKRKGREREEGGKEGEKNGFWLQIERKRDDKKIFFFSFFLSRKFLLLTCPDFTRATRIKKIKNKMNERKTLKRRPLTLELLPSPATMRGRTIAGSNSCVAGSRLDNDQRKQCNTYAMENA